MEKKKKIAVVYDIDGWAFSNIAHQIQKNLSDDFEIDIIPKSVFEDNVVKLVILARQYDLVHLLWRGIFSYLESDFSKGYLENMGLKQEEFIEEYMNKIHFTTSVYDHSFLEEETFPVTQSFLKYAKAYTVCSQKLKKIYDEDLRIMKKPSVIITDGVDLCLFKPKNLEKFETLSNRKMIVGWVGNSKFTDSSNDNDLKGVRSIIIPAIQELEEEGYPITLQMADGNVELIPHDQMPEYYQKIDLYVCASKEEGTPNPVLEAMATGIPVISTDVGIVPEAFGPKQRKYILQERSKEELKEKLKILMNKKEEMKELSQENLQSIKQFSWEKKCQDFQLFFRENISK